MTATPNYNYHRSDAAHTHGYLMPVVETVFASIGQDKTIFELGCGNGATAGYLTSKGYSVVGVDPSESGIAIAKENFPECSLELGSTEDDEHRGRLENSGLFKAKFIRMRHDALVLTSEPKGNCEF